MTSQIIPFEFNSKSVRVITKNDQPWFVAADIAVALEYRDAEVATRYLDEDEKEVHQIGVPPQPITLINESGLYSLILRSRKPEAKKFKKWVTAEVLPAIRKTGRYEADQPAPPQIPPALADYLDRRATGLAIEYRGEILRRITALARARLSTHTPEQIQQWISEQNGSATPLLLLRDDVVWLSVTVKALNKELGDLSTKLSAFEL